MSNISIHKRATAEFIGTAFLVTAVIGSGIMGERLSGGNVALAFLANTVATGAALVALIMTFGSVSGAHFNPAVTVSDAIKSGMPWREVPAYVGSQVLGGLTGTAVAHLMFREPLFSLSQHGRNGPAQLFSEFVATFGLLAVIWGCAKYRANGVPFAVGAYITGAYWFTSSTSFANPAVTIARSLSNTFAGIRPADVPAFIAVQMGGAIAATFLFSWLTATTAEEILMPRESEGRKTYVFACVHNAGRSQMAAALFNIYAIREQCQAISAGTEPAKHVHPEVVEVMREIGIDLSSANPQKLTPELAQTASVLVTMGCGESCPFVPGLRTMDWSLPDPKGRSIEDVRAIRDDIHDRVKKLIRTDCATCCTVTTVA